MRRALGSRVVRAVLLAFAISTFGVVAWADHNGCSGEAACATGCTTCVSAPSCVTCDGCDDACCCAAKPSTPCCTKATGCCCPVCVNQWSVFAEAMFLRRGDAGGVPLVGRQNQAGRALVNGDDLDFDHEIIPRIHLRRDFDNCWGLDIGYFGTDAFDTVERGGGAISPALVVPGLPPFAGTAPGSIFAIEYGTDLHSFEANIRRRINSDLVVFAGFRWLEVDDALRAYQAQPAFFDIYRLRSRNNLYGFQVGADACLFRPNSTFSIDSVWRAGLLGNDIDYTAQSAFTAAIPAPWDA